MKGSDVASASVRPEPSIVESESDFLAWAYASLQEINPSNYDHEDVCSMNAASVEVMLAIKTRLDALSAQKDAPNV